MAIYAQTLYCNSGELVTEGGIVLLNGVPVTSEGSGQSTASLLFSAVCGDINNVGASGDVKAETVSASIESNIKYNSAHVNVGSRMNLSTGVWTSTETATLLINTTIYFRYSGTRKIISARLNENSYQYLSDSTGYGPNGMLIIPVCNGDTIEVTYQHDYNGQEGPVSKQSYVQIFKLK